MRILQVIASMAPRYGGPSTYCPALCRELARRGHEVTIYTTNADGERKLDVPLDQPILCDGLETRYFPAWLSSREYKFSRSLWRALREKVPMADVVHIYSMYIFSATAAAKLCRKFGVPYLLHPHGTLDPYLLRRHRLRKWVYSALFERAKFRDASAILFNSVEEMRLAASWLDPKTASPRPGHAAIRTVVPVGVESEWFAPANTAAHERFGKRFPELAGRRIILFYGRLSFKKGLEILAPAFVEVARSIGDVYLVLAGPDTEGYGDKVREWLQAGGVLQKATLTGVLAGEDRVAAMQQAAILVLPSYTENFGQVVAEAMACSVPVVVSDRVNLWKDVAAAGAGLVVPCDVRQTAQALLTLLEDAGLGRQMGARGRRWAEGKFSWNVVGDQMVQLYRTIANGRMRTG